MSEYKMKINPLGWLYYVETITNARETERQRMEQRPASPIHRTEYAPVPFRGLQLTEEEIETPQANIYVADEDIVDARRQTELTDEDINDAYDKHQQEETLRSELEEIHQFEVLYTQMESQEDLGLPVQEEATTPKSPKEPRNFYGSPMCSQLNDATQMDSQEDLSLLTQGKTVIPETPEPKDPEDEPPKKRMKPRCLHNDTFVNSSGYDQCKNCYFLVNYCEELG